MARARGEGTISKHPKGWAGALTLGYDGNGRRRRRWVYGKTQKEVLGKLEALKKQLGEGSYVEPSRITVAALLKKFIEAKARATKARTVEIYSDVSRRYLIPHLGAVRLQKLTPLQIEEALAQITSTVSPDAAAKSRAILFRAMRQAVRWGLTSRNPVEAVENIRVTRAKPKLWTPHQAALFFAQARPHRLFAAFYLGLACGLRRGEILGLGWEDVTPGGLHIRQHLTLVNHKAVLEPPKTPSAKRFVPYAPDVYQILLAHQAQQEHERAQSAVPWPETGLVFTSLVGTPMNPHNFERTWYALQDKANGVEEALAEGLKQAKNRADARALSQQIRRKHAQKRIQLHSLRRTFATWEIALGGADPKTLAAKLGHTRASFTLDVYAQQFAETRQAQALSLTAILPALGGGEN